MPLSDIDHLTTIAQDIAMVVVQELAVKVGDLGDVDESAHNSVDALKTSKPCDTELDSEQKAEWEEKIRNAQGWR